MSISVVIPALNEADEIEATLRAARSPLVAEIIVVDGGSEDGTVERARDLADAVIEGGRGRAAQMNEGAAHARASTNVLLFVHADTWLPAGFAEAIEASIRVGAVGGRFDARLRGSHPLLPVVAKMMNLRSRLTGISTGDQAIFVRRDVFAALGGFPSIPLMEDVAFTSRLKRYGRIAALRARVSTSARRWEEFGVVRTILLMWRLRLAYALGADPEKLARSYRSSAKRMRRSEAPRAG